MGRLGGTSGVTGSQMSCVADYDLSEIFGDSPDTVFEIRSCVCRIGSGLRCCEKVSNRREPDECGAVFVQTSSVGRAEVRQGRDREGCLLLKQMAEGIGALYNTGCESRRVGPRCPTKLRKTAHMQGHQKESGGSLKAANIVINVAAHPGAHVHYKCLRLSARRRPICRVHNQCCAIQSPGG